MDFLEKILRNFNLVNKKANNSFNLSKYSQQYDITGDPALYTQEKLDAEERGEQPQSEELDFTSFQNNQELNAFLDNFIAQVQSGNIPPFPLDLYNKITSDASTMVYLQTRMQQAFGNQSEFIMREALEKTQSSQPNEGKDLPVVGDVDLVSLYLAREDIEEIFKNMQRMIVNHIQVMPGKNKWEAASDVIMDSISLSFSPKGERGLDQRLNFFLNYPQFLPENMQDKVELLNSNEELKSSQKIEFLESAKDELIYILADLIKNKNPKVDEWVLRKTSNAVGKNIYREKQQFGDAASYDAPVDDEGTSHISNMGDGGKTVNARELTKEEKQQVMNLADEKLRVFLTGYLNEILKDTFDLTSKTYESIIKAVQDDKIEEKEQEGQEEQEEKQKGPQEKKNKMTPQFKRKLLNKANRLYFYMDSAYNQISMLINQNQEKIKEHFGDKFEENMNIIRRPGELVYNQGGLGKITVPKSEIEQFFAFYADEAKTSITNLDINNQTLKKVVDEYIDSNSSDWMPNWTSWVKANALAKRFQVIGQIIKAIKEQGEKREFEQVDDVLHLSNSLFNGDKRRAKQFFDYAKNMDDRELQKWLYAGDNSQGGIKELKGQFTTDVASFLPYLYEMRDEYDPIIMKTFFNLVKPHRDYYDGGKNALSKVKGYEDMNACEMFHNLIKEEPPKDEMEMRKYEKQLKRNLPSKRERQELVEQLRTNEDMPADARVKRIQEMQQEWKNIQSVLNNLQEYRDAQKGKQTLLKKIEKAELNLLAKEKNERHRYKRDKDGKLIPPKGIVTLKNKIKNFKDQLGIYERMIQNYENSPDNITKTAPPLLEMMRNAYIEANKKIIRLSSMKSNLSNLKTADSSIKDIDDIIFKIKEDFINRFGYLFH